MQFGHLAVVLAISTYDWKPETVAFVLGMHMLPNADVLLVKAKLAKPDFHCTVTHSIFFALIVSGIISIFSPHYGLFSLVAILSHYAADIGSTVGLPLLWPFSKRKFTLALFKDTGFWGEGMITGYYRQPMSWVLEGAVVILLAYRLYMIYI
ncbi:MAG: metal-dependent hydrolase [Candidatus Zixiibacteriota bacterium]|nr:MAG: metal-dependent hydrolase [candidate division Zixibacteria bacterium]